MTFAFEVYEKRDEKSIIAHRKSRDDDRRWTHPGRAVWWAGSMHLFGSNTRQQSIKCSNRNARDLFSAFFFFFFLAFFFAAASSSHKCSIPFWAVSTVLKSSYISIVRTGLQQRLVIFKKRVLLKLVLRKGGGTAWRPYRVLRFGIPLLLLSE